MESKRQMKFERLIQREVGEIFQKEARNLLGSIFATITAVKMSPDLGFAKVYVSIMQERDRKMNFKVIEEHKSEIRKYLGRRIGKSVRVIPELAFTLDETEDQAARIDSILSKLDIPPAPEE
ncbi:MAG: 30S ribosome-binding factor RbfA [Cyclobacteriaceae bacterium]